MKNKVCMYLPPFAGDYSGVASTLFDLGGMICIHDAAGCTGNYTHFDEPRWYGSESMVYCTGLRKMEAILGDEEKFINRIINNAMEKKPEFIAIVGSPVPNVIGFDFKGVANAIGKRTNIPTFGFATAGIKGSYKDGIVMAARELMDHYRRYPAEGTVNKAKKLAAVPGISPLDMPQDIYEKLQRLTKDLGLTLIQKSGDYGSLDFYKHPENVNINIVLNQAGYEIAAYMKEEYGIPFVTGFPIGAELINEYKKCVNDVLAGNCRRDYIEETNEVLDSTCKGLVIADGVTGISVRKYLRSLGAEVKVGVISGDFRDTVNLNNEDLILEEVSKDYDFVIADPLILELVPDKTAKISLPHYAVSSRVGKNENWDYLDEKNWIERLGSVVNKAVKKPA
ncbi:MAG: hypothetical protein K6C99_11725 [Lachnospiraceae bacterium]|nr:hypothetical protein [Lachnospiraceae bacterium]